jgi:hypothetical protein
MYRLAILDLSDNRLTGEIPWNLHECKSVHTIKLDNNDLSGEVCTGIVPLRGLMFVYMYDNPELDGLEELAEMFAAQNDRVVFYHKRGQSAFPQL